MLDGCIKTRELPSPGDGEDGEDDEDVGAHPEDGRDPRVPGHKIVKSEAK